MNAFEQWEAANNAYLGAALADIRARLDRLAVRRENGNAASAAPDRAETTTAQLATGTDETDDARIGAQRAPSASTAPPSRPSWLGRMFSRAQTLPAVASVIAHPAAADIAPPIVETAAPPSTDTAPAPAIALLAERLGLSEFERNVLLLCAAMELDTRTGAACARAQGDPARPYPTFGLAMALFDRTAWEAMSPERPLRYWRLVEINQAATQPLIASVLRADERIVNYIKGVNYLDDRLSALLSAPADPAPPLPASQQLVADDIVEALHAAAANGALPVVQLVGGDSASKGLVAQTVGRSLGLTVHRIGADALPSGLADRETFVRLWQRESALMPIALHVDAADTDRLGAQAAAIAHVLARIGGLVMLDVREPWANAAWEALLFDVAKPTAAEQKAVWADALDAVSAASPARLAAHFNFGVATVRRLASDAVAVAKDHPETIERVLWSKCLARARPALDQLAQLVDAKARWDDLELPAAEKALLRQIADQVEHRATVYDDWGFRARMNRGLGISVLFAGESGTGKTMAAEAIANELGLLLYRIDLSGVVNKYIGETEKNLRRVFDAAEDGGSILLFDEADALFGRRSEVKDSHDRYSNIEVNYLLQRLEAFRGLAILATNMKNALDPAFARRLRFIVRFPFPGQAERKAIWQGAFPASVGIDALDFEQLARFNLSGGCIHNIALASAFLAAGAKSRVTMSLVLEATRNELRKLDRPINEADFRRLASVPGAA
jgi:ATPase family protein associated with various cellular activities (AAA)/winged helix domain-containing protein